MKTKILSLLFTGLSVAAIAQNGSVGIGTVKPDNSAILDLSSSNKGLLIPRMSISDRDAIFNPAIGLKIYQTDGTPGEYSFDGKKWNRALTEGDAKSVTLDVANWSKTGDAGTNPSSNFLGTTDNAALRFKVNGQNSGIIDNSLLNTALGYEAGKSFSSGNANTAIGGGALKANTTGIANLAFGGNALLKNVNGLFNTALGSGALAENIGGSYNIALGGQALGLNVSGVNNIAIGQTALYNNTSNFNMAFGTNALNKNTTGASNIAIGEQALYNNISGSNNLAFGSFAGQNSVGSGNLFIGSSAGSNETGNNKLYIANNNTANPLIKGDFTANTLIVNSKTTGFLAVGDFDAVTPMPTPTGYRLIVQDGILTEKIKVALKNSATDWADYVFDSNYNLKSLEQVEAFILENKHLPNVPSSEEMVKSGLDVAKTNKMLMEKIEELTLYVIQLNKEIKLLKK